MALPLLKNAPAYINYHETIEKQQYCKYFLLFFFEF